MNLRIRRWRKSSKKEKREKKEKSGSAPTRRRRFAVADLSGERERQTELLFMTICSGDVDELNRILDDPKSAYCDLSSEMLNCACATGNASTVTVLLERGVPLSSTSGKGDAPLHTAVRKGSLQIVKILLDFGADVNVPTRYERRTALHVAAALKTLEVLRYLLSNEADVDKTDIYGSTPLHLASEAGFSNGVHSLLEFGANPDLYNKDGWTAMHTAAVNGHMSVVEQLLEAHASVDCQNRFGRTPLHWACAAGHVAIVQLLLQHGASAEVTDKHGKTALDHAVNEDIKKLIDVNSEVGGLSVFPLISSCMHYTVGKSELRQAKMSAFTKAVLRNQLPLRDSLDSGCSFETWGGESTDVDGFQPQVLFPSFQSMISISDETRQRKIGICEKPENLFSPDEIHESSTEGDLRQLLRLNHRFEGKSPTLRKAQTLPPSMDVRTLKSDRPGSLTIFNGRSDSLSENSAPEMSKHPRGSLKIIHENDRPNASTSILMGREISRGGSSSTTRSSNISDDELKRTSGIDSTEQSTTSNPAETSRVESSESEEEEKERTEELEQESKKCLKKDSKRESGDCLRASKAITCDIIITRSDSLDDEDERFSENVKSVLDRMSFATDSDVGPLDAFATRFRNSSSAYIDAISSGFKQLLQHLEPAQND